MSCIDLKLPPSKEFVPQQILDPNGKLRVPSSVENVMLKSSIFGDWPIDERMCLVAVLRLHTELDDVRASAE